MTSSTISHEDRTRPTAVRREPRTFPTRSPLDEDHRRLLELLRTATDPLQLADVPVRHPVATAHGVAGFAHAHAALAPPADGHRAPGSPGHGALQPLAAHRVAELPRAAAARLAFAGRAHGAAAARVEGLPCQTVARQPGAAGLVASGRTSDHVPVGELRVGGGGRREGDGYAQQGPKHDGNLSKTIQRNKVS